MAINRTYSLHEVIELKLLPFGYQKLRKLALDPKSKLRSFRDGKHIFVTQESIDEFLNHCEIKPKSALPKPNNKRYVKNPYNLELPGY